MALIATHLLIWWMCILSTIACFVHSFFFWLILLETSLKYKQTTAPVAICTKWNDLSECQVCFIIGLHVIEPILVCLVTIKFIRDTHMNNVPIIQHSPVEFTLLMGKWWSTKHTTEDIATYVR